MYLETKVLPCVCVYDFFIFLEEIWGCFRIFSLFLMSDLSLGVIKQLRDSNCRPSTMWHHSLICLGYYKQTHLSNYAMDHLIHDKSHRFSVSWLNEEGICLHECLCSPAYPVKVLWDNTHRLESNYIYDKDLFEWACLTFSGPVLSDIFFYYSNLNEILLT